MISRADGRYDAAQILLGIQDLLDNPNIRDPAQEKAFVLFRDNKAEYPLSILLLLHLVRFCGTCPRAPTTYCGCLGVGVCVLAYAWQRGTLPQRCCMTRQISEARQRADANVCNQVSAVAELSRHAILEACEYTLCMFS